MREETDEALHESPGLELFHSSCWMLTDWDFCYFLEFLRTSSLSGFCYLPSVAGVKNLGAASSCTISPGHQNFVAWRLSGVIFLHLFGQRFP